MPDGTEFVVGGGRRVGDRCIIPVIRTFVIDGGGTAVISLTPVALLIAEGEDERLTLLPGAPPGTGKAVKTLHADIERQKEKCMG
ncbi:hypothetical protein [Methanoculleus sp.]|uniref:hypothetical protein n=1 Tax=Methanoculleus sp. TaxID=90427 RepID=UPI0025F9AD8C|nr:hypothetical protein [Methanoculleus sp.]